MNTQYYHSSESRIIFHNVESIDPVNTSEGDAPQPSSIIFEHTEDPKNKKFIAVGLQLLSKDNPRVHELAEMDDKTYNSSLSRDMINETMPETEASRDCFRAIHGMIEAIDELFEKKYNDRDLHSIRFEEFLSDFGRIIDTHIMPLVQKYEHRDEELLRGLMQMGVREEMLSDLTRKETDPTSIARNPMTTLREVADMGYSDNFDQVLLKEMEGDTSLPELQKKYEEQKDQNEGEAKKEAEGMLAAIKRLLESRQKIVDRYMFAFVQAKLPFPVTFTLDLKDAEVVMKVAKEDMEEFDKFSENNRIKEGSFTMTIDGKKHTVVYDQNEKSYEVIVSG